MSRPHHRTPSRAHPGNRGFTLIELLVTVAVIGLLASIAYPSYLSAIGKTRRTDAKAALLDLAMREERAMSTANAYTADPVALGYGAGTALPLPIASGGAAFYTLSISVTNAGTATQGYVALATPTGPQASDACGIYEITNTGAQAVAGGTGSAADCW